jgi:hypothetical protein
MLPCRMCTLKLKLRDDLSLRHLDEWSNALLAPSVVVVTGLLAHEISGN